ncbi:DUF6629 family protein [Streptomyces sp. NPDC006879]|uniref:DUF6629 family protein n=1 Tax=Streptomyces sp. NPDC006879 TaxID=3364767 RepID=UPI00369B3F8E
MCGSASADLVAGVAISGVGVACVAGVRRLRELPLAALPLLLGVHQVIEAAVWRSGGGAGLATTAWAVIALPLLAVWVPWSVLIVALPGRRGRQVAPALVGAVTAAVLARHLATTPVRAEIRGHTVGYVLALDQPGLLMAAYLFATLGSLLFCADRRLRQIGVVIAVGAVVCALLWRREFVSTWCAVAALASLLVWGWVRRGAGRVSGPPLRGA